MTNPAVPRRFWPAIEVENLPEGAARLVRFKEADVLVFHQDGQFFALDNACPHVGAPIGPERFDGETVTCGYHGMRFCIRTGRCPDAPGFDAETYPVRVEEGKVLVGLPDW